MYVYIYIYDVCMLYVCVSINLKQDNFTFKFLYNDLYLPHIRYDKHNKTQVQYFGLCWTWKK